MARDAAAIRHFRCAILTWYRENGRRFPWRNKSATQYQRIVSEVLLQRTKAETVAKYFHKFINSYPSWKTLANGTEEELGLFLKPLGLWKRRAPSLLKLAQELTKRSGRFPKKREDIEKLSNVGQYISNAIFLFCHGEPQPLLDVNMARVLERYFGKRKLADIRYDRYLQVLSRKVIDCDDPVSINWAILDYSAKVCKANKPLCDSCIIRSSCRYCNRTIRNTKQS